MLDRERPGQKEVSVVYQSFYGPPGTISLGEDHEESAGPARQECNSSKSYVCSEAFSTSWLGYSGFYAVNPRGGINSSHDPDCPLFYVNLLSGDISHAVFSVSGNTIEAPDEVLSRRPRGGMLCDEPGLGKSVTMLAVILRSLGTVATPPVQGGTAATITGTRWHYYLVTTIFSVIVLCIVSQAHLALLWAAHPRGLNEDGRVGSRRPSLWIAHTQPQLSRLLILPLWCPTTLCSRKVIGYMSPMDCSAAVPL